jgi:hypothetical protein
MQIKLLFFIIWDAAICLLMVMEMNEWPDFCNSLYTMTNTGSPTFKLGYTNTIKRRKLP